MRNIVMLLQRVACDALVLYSAGRSKEDAQQMAAQPTGTVTLLFTDIEGSTRLWERDARKMRAALNRHDEMLRHAIGTNGGYVFKTVGDAFCAAFASAPAAVEAACAAQRSIFAEPWDEECRLRVRMALHTGAVETRGGDYFGSPVNRVARLLSAGHGGQTLLSLATTELARDQLPEGAELRDLGERRLKDLFRSERVFQIVLPGLPASSPPLRTIDSRLNNLPAQPTPLVGREREIGEVCGLLRREGVRLLTLTGPGGTGKTRLGLQAAAELLDEHEGGAFLVELAPVTDPVLVPSTIAESLGVTESGEQPLTESLIAYLGEKEILLVLDNFEQVLDGAPVVGELLSSCPKLKVLATSRVVLGLYGEQQYAVPPLAVPDPKRLPSAERAGQYEAVRLFVERARAVKSGFRVTNENAPAVAGICVRLDGLPLAIELAAARTKILPPEAMLKRLQRRLELLSGGARDLPARQRTLRGAIEWSHDLLDEGERMLFARLAVFSGGRTLEAIETVCDATGDLPVDTFDGVCSLVDKSLLRQEEGAGGEPRFVMLETTHEFAREKLEASGKSEEINRLHVDYFTSLAEKAEPELKGPRQLEWLDRLEAEHDNFRVALSWSLESGETDLALRLAGALWWFWFVRGHITEGRRWLEASSADGAGPAAYVAKALNGAGRFAVEQGEVQKATATLEEAVRLLRGTVDEEGLADALNNLGAAAVYGNDLDRAEMLLEESLALFRESGNQWGIAEVLNNFGVVAVVRNEMARCKGLYEESLAVRRQAGDQRGIVMSLHNLAESALGRGDLQSARMMNEESLALGRELSDQQQIALALQGLGTVEVLLGDPDRAAVLLEESTLLLRDLGDQLGIYECLMVQAAASGVRGDDRLAARLFGAADGLRESKNLFTELGAIPLRFDRFRSVTNSRLGEVAWEAAYAEGRAMTPEQAVAFAVEVARPGSSGTSVPGRVGSAHNR